MVAIVLGEGDNDYSKIIGKLVKSAKGNGYGQMYYIPRIRIVIKEGICDYFVWKNHREVRFLVLPAFQQLINELQTIAKACVAKLEDGGKRYSLVLNEETCYVKIPLDVDQKIPAHRYLKLCVDVYGLYISDNKAYLQFELSDWKADITPKCLL
jgi:hypothetical protein